MLFFLDVLGGCANLSCFRYAIIAFSFYVRPEVPANVIFLSS